MKANNNGVTLLSLSIYIIAILIVIALMSSIRGFFQNNISLVKEQGRYAADFDKFNSYFVKDVKLNKDAYVTTDSSASINENLTITFEDGTQYVYNESDSSLYRNKIKLASNVSVFTASKKTIMINSVNKNILSIKILIGTNEKTMFNESIDYTLKYW